MPTYTCSHCGHDIQPAQTPCPACGSEILWEEGAPRVRYISRLAKLGRPRGPRQRSLLLISGGLIAAMIILLLAGLWGLERGLQERQSMIAAVTFAHYRQGWAHLLQGQTAAARAEFDQVVALQPARTATPTPTATPTTGPTPTATPTPAPTLPSPTPRIDSLPPEQALTLIQAALDAGEWRTAIEQLHALTERDPGYQPGLLGQMLFHAHYNLALQHEAAGDIDSAALELSKALHLRPGNTAALKLQRAIQLYRSGQAALGQDWEAAIAAFSELYAADPAFLDTPDQLFRAYTGLADSLRRSDPCAALERYQLALQLQRDPQVRAKLEDARLRCSDLSQGEEGESSAGADESAAAPPRGQIAFTSFDSARTYHSTQIWQVEAGAPGPIIAPNTLQPHFAATGQIAARATTPSRFGITLFAEPGAEGQRLTTGAGDSFPRWSPDGQQILFQAESRSSDQEMHLYLLTLAGGAITDLGPGSDGAWSPDGRRIVYNGCDAATGQRCGLWLLDQAGGERRQLTTVASDSKPDWSPDGNLIVFMSAGRSSSWDIFVADAENGNIPLFSLGESEDGLPVWSPDGGAVAFLSNREGAWAVYLWRLSDLTVTRLFALPGPLPAWQEASLDWAP